jgi:hypothetical protein
MTELYLLAAFICTLAALAFLAIPEKFVSQYKSKKVSVDGTYWGPYVPLSYSSDKRQIKTIEVQRVYSPHKAIAGMTSYTSGKGTG